MQTLALSFVLLSPLVYSTTEWWGDLRAHLNPAKSPAFYDVMYDETGCPEGLHSDAIPDYVYFGTMIATMSVNEYDECLQKCIEKPQCKAVNYFHRFVFQKKGFCELLSETQHDNPRQMRQFYMATYFENIRCQDSEYTTPDLIHIVPGSNPNRKKEFEMNRLVEKLPDKVNEFDLDFRVAR